MPSSALDFTCIGAGVGNPTMDFHLDNFSRLAPSQASASMRTELVINKTLPDSGMSQWAGPRGGMLTEGPARGLTCPGSRASIQWLSRWISPHGVALLSPLAFLAPR